MSASHPIPANQPRSGRNDRKQPIADIQDVAMPQPMAYSDDQQTRWDRIAAFTLWLVSWPVLTATTLQLIVEECFWEQGCDTSQAQRFIAAIALSLAVASAIGWAACWIMNRVFYRVER